ncbi:MAG: hypothetical protein SWZ49_14025 [Cyanobacteriota bacterium]|nr:hypothetical protein [Cyanobacteriota bacterium]
MKSNRIKSKLDIAKHYCLSVVSCALLLSAAWFGVWFDSAQAAIATPVDGFPQQVIAANPLRGMGDKLEGNVEQGAGKAQRNLGSGSDNIKGAAKEVEGLTKQAKGNAKQGIEKAKSTADNAGDKLEEGSENAIDAVKDFFGN